MSHYEIYFAVQGWFKILLFYVFNSLAIKINSFRIYSLCHKETCMLNSNEIETRNVFEA